MTLAWRRSRSLITRLKGMVPNAFTLCHFDKALVGFWITCIEFGVGELVAGIKRLEAWSRRRNCENVRTNLRTVRTRTKRIVKIGDITFRNRCCWLWWQKVLMSGVCRLTVS